MSKETIQFKPSDNQYLHKDFHIALNNGLEYLYKNYGEKSVIEYIKKFARTFYAPLNEKLKTEGLIALKKYFEDMFKKESGKIEIKLEKDKLIIKVNKCPALTHLIKNNVPITRLFHETTRTVNKTICEGTGYSAELINYNHKNGSCTQCFYRKRSH